MSDEGGECDSRTKRQQCPVAPISRPGHHSSSTMCINITKKIENEYNAAWHCIIFRCELFLVLFFSPPCLGSLGAVSALGLIIKVHPLQVPYIVVVVVDFTISWFFWRPPHWLSPSSRVRHLSSWSSWTLNTEQGLSTKIQLVEKSHRWPSLWTEMKFVATTGRVKFLPALHSVKSTKVAHLFYNLTINILHIRLKSQQNSNNKNSHRKRQFFALKL